MMLKKLLAGLICAVVVAVFAPPAWAHTVNRAVPLSRAVERPDGYRAVVDELRAWNLTAARGKIEALEAKTPGLAEWLALSGAADYLEGRYAESLANLNAALKKRPGDSEWLELRLHVRQTQTAMKGFQAYQTAHFDIWYEPGEDAVLLPYLGDALEQAYARYGAILGVWPKQRIRVELFSDSVRFHRSSTLSRRDIEEKGAVGVCKFNKVMFLSPGALLRGYRWLDTAAHEYVHYLIVLATKNRAPIWLHEGIAKYLEKKWRDDETGFLHPGEEALLFKARETNNYVPFRKMEPSLIYLDTRRRCTSPMRRRLRPWISSTARWARARSSACWRASGRRRPRQDRKARRRSGSRTPGCVIKGGRASLNSNPPARPRVRSPGFGWSPASTWADSRGSG